MNARTLFLLIACGAHLAGCATPPPPPPSPPPVPDPVLSARIDALAAQLKTTECLGRLNMATSTCIALHMGEANGLALQNSLAACIRNKGFPQGANTCQ